MKDLTTLWSNENTGEVAHAHCGGAYLSSAVEMFPQQNTHITPLGTWHRVTADDLAYWAENVSPNLGPLDCDPCRTRKEKQ